MFQCTSPSRNKSPVYSMDEGAQIFAEMFPNYFSSNDEQYHVICQNEENQPQFIQLHVETTEENYVEPVRSTRHPYYNNYQHPQAHPDPDPESNVNKDRDKDKDRNSISSSIFLSRLSSCPQNKLPREPRCPRGSLKKNWLCLVCGKEFGWQSSLRLHLRKHANNYNKNASRDGENHIHKFKGLGLNDGIGPPDIISVSSSPSKRCSRLWGCQYAGCSFTARTKKLLNQHLKTHEGHHSRNGKCSTCEYQQKLDKAMVKYLNQPVTPPATTTIPLLQHFDHRFEEKYRMMDTFIEPPKAINFDNYDEATENHHNHLYHHHHQDRDQDPMQNYHDNEETCSSTESDITIKSEPPDSSDSPDLSPQMLCCSACDFTTMKQIEYKDHIVSSHKIVRYKCGLCEFSCSQQTPLVQHMRTSHVNGKEPFHRLRWSCDFY